MKRMFLFIIIGLILLAIPATIYVLNRQKDIRAKAAPATTLSITPLTQDVDVGNEQIKLTVQMDPGQNQVISANLYFTYDPAKLDVISITNGTNAPQILSNETKDNGTASISVGAASNTQPITTPGPIAVLTLRAVGSTTALTPTEIQFASNTFVAALDDPSTNVLMNKSGASITITDPTPALPTATPTATPSATLTPSLTPTLTPTIPATNSGEATGSAIAIYAPIANEEINTTQPVIQGSAPPGSTVTIVVYSAQQTATVTADENGNWSYTPATPLETGPHSVVASVLSAAGTTETTTTSFVVVAAEGSGGGTESTEAMPVSGSVETTIILITVAILIIVAGTFLWHF